MKGSVMLFVPAEATAAAAAAERAAVDPTALQVTPDMPPRAAGGAGSDVSSPRLRSESGTSGGMPPSSYASTPAAGAAAAASEEPPKDPQQVLRNVNLRSYVKDNKIRAFMLHLWRAGMGPGSKLAEADYEAPPFPHHVHDVDALRRYVDAEYVALTHGPTAADSDDDDEDKDEAAEDARYNAVLKQAYKKLAKLIKKQTKLHAAELAAAYEVCRAIKPDAHPVEGAGWSDDQFVSEAEKSPFRDNERVMNAVRVVAPWRPANLRSDRGRGGRGRGRGRGH
jgi:hypothetical protein